jgi:hypothetical protein
MTTRSEENELISAIEQAVKSGLSPTRSIRLRTCAVCEGEIAIGGNVIELPGTKSKTFTVCSGCFELYRSCPGPRPME